MRKYSDVPMDLADASLVVLLEVRRMDMIFSTDAHFRVYRLANRRAIKVVPGP